MSIPYFLEYWNPSILMSERESAYFLIWICSNVGIFWNSATGMNMHSTVGLSAMMSPKKPKPTLLMISDSPKKSPFLSSWKQ